MGRMPKSVLILVFAFLAVLAGCSTGEQKTAGTASRLVSGIVAIKTFFPEDIHAVDRIEMLKAGGERKAFIDKAVIDGWIGQIGEIRVTVDPDPEESSGVLFQVQAFANGERKLSLTPRTVNGAVIAANDELTERMHQLWNEGDTRQPSDWGELPFVVGAARRAQRTLAEAGFSDENEGEAALQEINAELSLDRTFFNLNQTADTTMHLKNDGPTALYIGEDYSIEQWENGTWYRLPLSLRFSARAAGVEPGEVYSQNVRIPALLPAGKYRVVKGVQSMDTESFERSDPVYLAVQFLIGRND